MARLEWFFDVICPQVAVAAARVGTLLRETGHEPVLRPVSLARMYERQRLPSQPELAWPANKRALQHRDTHRQAEDAGIHLRGPLYRPVTESTAAQQLITGAPEAARAGLLHSLLGAAWERGKPLDDEDLLRRLADDHGVDPGVITATESGAALERTTDEALDRGAFGVPTFMLDDRLWWGADRLAFVAGALGGAASTPRPAANGRRHRLEVFHDFSSPFSYLACTQVERVAAEHGAELVWKPMLLGALFKAIGTPMIPLQAMSANRQAWGERDMRLWADHWGVPFRFTSHFPLNTVLALRVSAVEPTLIQPLYRAAWVEDRDLGEPDTVAAIIREQGHDPEDVIARASAEGTKALIKANTREAEERGVCGAPTLVVDDWLVFWGQDRLDMVRRALDGWVPEVDAAAGPLPGAASSNDS